MGFNSERENLTGKNQAVLDGFVQEILTESRLKICKRWCSCVWLWVSRACGEEKQQGILCSLSEAAGNSLLSLCHLGAAQAAGNCPGSEVCVWISPCCRGQQRQDQSVPCVCVPRLSQAAHCASQSRVNIQVFSHTLLQVFSHTLLLSICLSLSLSVLWCIRTTEQVKFLCFLL